MNIPLYIWTFFTLLHFAPPESRPQFDGHEETVQETIARYGEIAEAITDVCQEKRGGRTCASLLIAIGVGESGLARDADVGPCYREGGYKKRCDGGHAASIWQVHAVGGNTVDDYFRDRTIAADVAYRAATSSLKRCAHLPREDRLAMLSGSCEPPPKQLESARARYRLWIRVNDYQPEAP